MPPQRRILSAFAVLLALIVAGRASAAPPSPVAAGQGRVQFVTGKRAYLDRGSAAGLAAGQALALFRNGRPVPGCTVETTAPHGATCTGGRPRPGDRFVLPRPPSRREPPAPRRLPPPADEATLRAEAGAIAAADFDKVDFSGAGAFGEREWVELGAGYGTFAAGAQGDRFGQQRLEGSLRVPLGRTGLRLEADFSAVRWETRPERARFRSEQRWQLYLWEAEVSRRDADADTVAAVGRLWPWHTPGLGILDGVQVGRRNRARTAEWGAYAGLVPDALALAPSTQAWAAGLYGASTQRPAAIGLRLARQEGRLGVRRQPDGALVPDAEGLAQLWLGPLELGGGGRLRFGAPDESGVGLAHAHLHARTRPDRAWAFTAQLRYLGRPDGEAVVPADQLPALAARYRGTFAAHFDPFPWIGLGAFAGAQADGGVPEGNGADGGIELRLPRLLGDAGGAWVGAEASQGGLTRRELYLMIFGRPTTRVRVIGRASASATSFLRPEISSNTQELGGYLHLDAALPGRLRLGSRALLRLPVVVRGAPLDEPSPTGALELDLTGTF
jgi:hypothetical protein